MKNMNNRYKNNYSIKFTENMIAMNRSLVESIIMGDELSTAFNGKEVYEILEIPQEFYNEIIAIIQKYQKCTLKKITQKVLYECTYHYYSKF